MKIVIQRVSEAKVEVAGELVGAIGRGVLVFIGITHTDTIAEAQWLANKLVHLRIFEDENGKMNKSLIEQKGGALIVSQFTLYGDCSAGRRPSFIQAAEPSAAQALYKKFGEEIRKTGIDVHTGIFGADMKVSLLNDGPVTLILERN